MQRWLSATGIALIRTRKGEEVIDIARRSQPRFVLADGRQGLADETVNIVRRLKADPFSAVIPVIMIVDDDAPSVVRALQAGADEVLTPTYPALEASARLDAAVRRSDRDVQVHPSTRMPGAVEIDSEIKRRMVAKTAFAACYADLDYFKEFNDRYSYYQGDRIIRITSLILHDVVKGLCGTAGFIGHIGGDDFIFIVPIESVAAVCAEIIDVFDTLIPFQYSDQDRQVGYFFGKDRRGQLHRVPLLTVSIGVVTTARRHFTHAAQVSALATEMKTYAKTLPGSVYTVDRRQDDEPVPTRSSAPMVPPSGERGTT